MINLESVKSMDALIQTISEGFRDGKGRWLRGLALTKTNIRGNFLTDDLDKISREHPIVIRRCCACDVGKWLSH